MNYNEVVHYLENLGIMPKTAPGLHKISYAVSEKSWFHQLNSEKIITIAGTNGKGTTAAALEALLIDAGQKVGLYTSPHLISTTERIRIQGQSITEAQFVELFELNKYLIDQFQLSHFESLTLMAADLFFNQNLDYYIFEVGLGGTFDATNIFPNKYAVITKIGLDHQNILGHTILEISKNKFGIIKNKSEVIHHLLPEEALILKSQVQLKTNSNWTNADQYIPSYDSEQNLWIGDFKGDQFSTHLIGPRAIENCATAIKVFEKLGFNLNNHKKALLKINWPGRMQKIKWPMIQCPIFVSGDHNLQGVESLTEILKYYSYSKLHLIVGIGLEKSFEHMLSKLISVPRNQLYLTVTPFKGLDLADYPEKYQKLAIIKDKNVEYILNQINSSQDDMILITGSLYLVGKVLSHISNLSE